MYKDIYMDRGDEENQSEISDDSSIDEMTWMMYKRDQNEKDIIVDDADIDEDDIWLQRKLLQRKLLQRDDLIDTDERVEISNKEINQKVKKEDRPMTSNDIFSKIRKRNIYSKTNNTNTDTEPDPRGENTCVPANYMNVEDGSEILKDTESVNLNDNKKKIKVDKIEVVEGQSGDIDYYCFTKESCISSNGSMNMSVIKLEDGRHYIRLDQNIIELSDLMYFKSLKPQTLDPPCIYEDNKYIIYDDVSKIEVVLNSGNIINIKCDILIFERIISTLNRYYNKTSSKFI
jgi:hypothetical protein